MEWFAAPDYRLARFILERGLGLVYLIGFLVALNQFPALLGERGLLPAPRLPRPGRASGTRRASSISTTPTASSGRRGSRGRARRGDGGRPAASGPPLAHDALLARALGCSTSRSSTSGSASTASAGSPFCWRRDSSRSSWATRATAPAAADPPPLPLARVPGGARRGADQAAGRSLLAGPHLPRLPPRDPADAEPAELVLPSAAAAGSTGSRSSATTSPSSPRRSLLFLPQPIAGIAAPLMIVTQAYLMLSGNYAWLNLVTLVVAASPRSPTASRDRPAPLRRWRPRPPAGSSRRCVRRDRAGRAAQLLAGPQPVRPAAADELQLQPAAFGEHLRRVRERHPRAHEVVVEGTDADRAREDRRGGVRVQGQAGRPATPPAARSRRTTCGSTG